MRKIAVITGTRAEYGLLLSVLKAIQKAPELELLLIVGGMHLSQEFGYTIKEIERDGFKIDAKFDMLLSDDTGARMARSIGVGILEFVQIFELLKPDIILVHGDREEPFAATVAGVCLNIPVAHMSGGDVASGGQIDEAIRHSITKFASIHFPISEKSAERIIKLGEEPRRVYLTGVTAPLKKELLSANDLAEKFSLDLSQPLILVLQHPLTSQPEKSASQMRETMEAIKELGHQTIIIYPNADTGGKKMIEVIKEYEKLLFLKIFKNIPYKEYLSLMKIAKVIVGNSSSAITETPSLHLPAVNIGERQEGRERAENVIDVDYSRNQIKEAIKKAIYDKKFKEKIRSSKNPYLEGEVGEKIADILSKIKVDKKLLEKKITY